MVGGEHHQAATLAVPGQVRLELGDALLVECGVGFVEDPQRRRIEVEPRQGDAALLASGEGVAGNVLESTQPDGGQRFPDRLALGALVQGAEPGQVLFRGEQALDAGGMADPQQLAGQFGTLPTEGDAFQQDLAGSGLHQAAEQAQQAGLATAVRPTDLQHFPGFERQVQPFEEHPPITLAGEVEGLEVGTGHVSGYPAGNSSDGVAGRYTGIALHRQPGRGGIIHVIPSPEGGFFNRL